MSIAYNVWKEHLINFSKTIKGSSVVFKKSASIGYGADFINGVVECKNEDGMIVCVNQSVITGNNEAEMSFLIYRCCFSNTTSLQLNISRRDFFDKIFPTRRIKTGNKIFDRTFTINSTDKKIALAIFKDEEVQRLFLSNSLALFNISTENDITEVKVKHMQKKLYSIEEMQKALDDFNIILSFL